MHYLLLHIWTNTQPLSLKPNVLYAKLEVIKIRMLVTPSMWVNRSNPQTGIDKHVCIMCARRPFCFWHGNRYFRNSVSFLAYILTSSSINDWLNGLKIKYASKYKMASTSLSSWAQIPIHLCFVKLDLKIGCVSGKSTLDNHLTCCINLYDNTLLSSLQTD